jgi:hypothetical protein
MEDAIMCLQLNRLAAELVRAFRIRRYVREPLHANNWPCGGASISTGK